MQVPRVRARAKERCREGHGRESTRRDCTALRMYMYYFRLRKRYKGIIPRSERPRAKRDVV